MATHDLVFVCEECGIRADGEEEALSLFSLRLSRGRITALQPCRCCRGQEVDEVQYAELLVRPQCNAHALGLAEQLADFGYRYHSSLRRITPQSWCRSCRSSG